MGKPMPYIRKKFKYFYTVILHLLLGFFTLDMNKNLIQSGVPVTWSYHMHAQKYQHDLLESWPAGRIPLLLYVFTRDFKDTCAYPESGTAPLKDAAS